ncbi:MAG: SOS response-associated peptidase [Euryarchaeota archaeon]|nr:SOS response-associated peptidase [Euryarchaeota archaeon]
MCYRKSIPDNKTLEQKFRVQFHGESFPQRFHVSAFSHEKLPVITDENPKQITLMNWGLIPFWTKDKKQADEIKQKTINARAETIYEKPSFRYSAEKKHCLVLADGFFEWHEHLGLKYPYYIHLKNHEPFAIAGLWDTWINPETKETIDTYTIITTEANSLMQIIHNSKKRMPVILPDGVERRWIGKDLNEEDAKQILTPLDSGKLQAYTISKLITTKGKDPNVSEVITPYNYPGITPSFNMK